MTCVPGQSAELQFQCHSAPARLQRYTSALTLSIGLQSVGLHASADVVCARTPMTIPLPCDLHRRALVASIGVPLAIRRRYRAPERRSAHRPGVLAAEAILLATQAVELHLAVQRRGVDQRVLRRQVDAAAVLLAARAPR